MGSARPTQILWFVGAAVFILALFHTMRSDQSLEWISKTSSPPTPTPAAPTPHIPTPQIPAPKISCPSIVTQPTPAPLKVQEPLKENRTTFLDVARKHGTDKVSPHSYHNMYNKYLEPLRDRPVKMLEIGLGCDMGYGPGASYYTWLEYFPHVNLYYIEYDAECAAKWASSTTGATIFTGDQADIPFLQRFIAESGGDFDIIVDDGGHTMTQQINSFDTLFPALKPGGIYFCEDLHTSYIPKYGGAPGKPDTMMERIKGSLDDLITANAQHDVMRDIWSIDCMREVCAFSKKELTGQY